MGGTSGGKAPWDVPVVPVSLLQLCSHQWVRSLQFESALDTRGPPPPAFVVKVDGQGQCVRHSDLSGMGSGPAQPLAGVVTGIGVPAAQPGMALPSGSPEAAPTGGDSAGDQAHARDPLADGEVKAGGEIPGAQSSGASALPSWPDRGLGMEHRV